MIDLHKALSVAESAAKAAGERIMRGFNEKLNVEQKGDISDRVTQVDYDCEEIIVSAIQKEYPDHSILSEEDLKARLQIPGAENQWIIDPLDGTSNFINRLPFCGTSIALEINGELQLGVLHFPAFGWTFSALRGEGAFRNGEKIQINDVSSLREAVVGEIFSDRIHRGKTVTYPPALSYRKTGSAITSLAFLAQGSIHAAALICYRWDCAAAEVIIGEAGGKLTWKYLEKEGDRESVLCIASVPGIEREFQNFVQKELKI